MINQIYYISASLLIRGYKVKTQPPSVTVIGVIVPSDWDKDDKIVGLAIQSIDEEEYIIEPNTKGKELHAFMNCQVKAEGKIHERVDGKRILNINRYTTR